MNRNGGGSLSENTFHIRVRSCHPENLSDSIRIPLSQLVEDLEIIRLENKDEAYVRNTSIRISENYILLHSSRNMPFKLFDRKGKFVCDIGSVSRLPGGYSQIYDFQLDEAPLSLEIQGVL